MLTKEQKHILFEEGTEPPGSSPLNYEKREGDYLCAGCGTKLFESTKKYESESGWPSFFEAKPNVFETKIDHLIGSPRTPSANKSMFFLDSNAPNLAEEILTESIV